MTRTRFWRVRFRSQLALFACIVSVSAVAIALLSSTAAMLENTSTVAAQQMFGAAEPTDQAVRVRADLGDDAAAQDALVRGVLTGDLGPAAKGVTRRLSAQPLPIAGHPQQSAVVEADASLAGRSTLIAGAWPTDASAAPGAPIPTSVQASVASALGLGVGDVVTVGSASSPVALLVVGTFTATDATDPAWFSDPSVSSGASGQAAGQTVGPFVVSEADLLQLPVTVTAAWVGTIDAGRLTADDLSALAGAAGPNNITAQLTAQAGPALGNLAVDGGVAATATRIARAESAASAMAVVPQVLTVLLAAICLGQLGSLVASARGAETAVLRARGASVGQLDRAAGLEAGILVAAGSVLGVGVSVVVGWLGASLFGEGAFEAGAPGGGAPGAGGLDIGASSAAVGRVWFVVVAAIALAVVVAARLAAANRLGPSNRPARLSAAARQLLATGIVVLVTALCTWQLVAAGTPLVVGADGQSRIDVVTTVASVLLIVAVTLVVVLAWPRLARWASAWLAGGIRTPSFLAAVQVGRARAGFSLVVTVIALACGGAVLVAALTSTWQNDSRTTEADAVGTDVRVALSVPPFGSAYSPLVQTEPYRRLGGVDAVAPVYTSAAQIGAQPVSLLAMDRDLVRSVMTAPGAPSDAALAALGDSVVDGSGDSGSPGAAVLPSEATALSLTLSAPTATADRTGTLTASAWLSTADGTLARVPFESVAVAQLVGAGVTVTATLPPGAGSGSGAAESSGASDTSDSAGWRLLAVDAQLQGSPGDPLAVSFTQLSSSVPGGTVTAVDLPGGSLASTTVSSSKQLGRSILGGASAAPLPSLVTEAFAAQQGLAVGDAVDLTLPSGRSIALKVAATAPELPGSSGPSAVFVDLVALNRALLVAGDPITPAAEVWVATSTPSAVARAAAAVNVFPASVSTVATASSAPLVTPTVVILWVAAGGGLLLALCAFSAALFSLARGRRDEVVVLRALGMDARAQSLGRALETVSAVVFGVLSGVVAGAAAAFVCAPLFAAAAVGAPGAGAGAGGASGVAGGAGAFGTSFDVVLLVVVLGAFASLVFGAGAVYAAVVQRAARSRPGRAGRVAGEAS